MRLTLSLTEVRDTLSIFSFCSTLSFAFPCGKKNTKASKQTEVLAPEFVVPFKPVYTWVSTEWGGPSSSPLCSCQFPGVSIRDCVAHSALGLGIGLA